MCPLRKKNNVDTCCLWNGCSVHPTEVNYLFRAQVLANLWSPNPELHGPLAVFLPVGSSYYLLPSTDLHRRLYTEGKLSSEKTSVLQLVKTWKLLSSDSQTHLLTRITLGALKKKYQCQGPAPEETRQNLWEWGHPGHCYSFKVPQSASNGWPRLGTTDLIHQGSSRWNRDPERLTDCPEVPMLVS